MDFIDKQPTFDNVKLTHHFQWDLLDCIYTSMVCCCECMTCERFENDYYKNANKYESPLSSYQYRIKLEKEREYSLYANLIHMIMNPAIPK